MKYYVGTSSNKAVINATSVDNALDKAFTRWCTKAENGDNIKFGTIASISEKGFDAETDEDMLFVSTEVVLKRLNRWGGK
jgi:hypothetical protein